MPLVIKNSIPPSSGQIVRVRQRHYVVEGAVSSTERLALVRLACLDDDAQGETLEVIWELELDAQIIDTEAWQSVGRKGFDDTKFFGAYLHTLRWNCITATDPNLFQAPFRAGIRIARSRPWRHPGAGGAGPSRHAEQLHAGAAGLRGPDSLSRGGRGGAAVRAAARLGPGLPPQG